MPVYTVTNAAMKKAVAGQHGPMQVIALDIRDPDGKEVAAEWFTKATTPLPQPGATMDGTVELTDYGWKFKKTPAAPFSGGGLRPRDPKESAAIVRQHSQSMALAAYELAYAIGLIEKPENTDVFRQQLRKWAAFFDEDVKDARDAA